MRFLIKTLVSALIIATIATLGKKFPTIAGIIASLPLTSVLALMWLYQDTKDVSKVADLSMSIFWVVIPSLVFFLALSILLKRNMNFYSSIMFSSAIMAITYYLYIYILRYFNINI